MEKLLDAILYQTLFLSICPKIFITCYTYSLHIVSNNDTYQLHGKLVSPYFYTKKSDPTLFSNHRPIALANTIYKLFTSTLTTILSGYGKKYQILHDSQEGFCAERSTTRQLQIIISALEDAKLTNQDIYLIYLIGNIYSQSTTKFTGAHFGETKPIHIQRSTIQGDTLSPYLFIIFIEPLLRWFQHGSNGYKFKASDATISSATYADDLVALTHTLPSIQTQLHKLDKFCRWSGMDLGISKCAITGCPNKSKMNPPNFKTFITSQNIHYRNQPIPILHQDEPYTYLGIQLVPSLK
jgi:hypothetical protein